MTWSKDGLAASERSGYRNSVRVAFAALMEAAEHDVLAHMAFPVHRTSRLSTQA